MKILVLSLIAVASLIQLGMSYPSGAPIDACESLMPNHGVASQPADTNPYEIIFSDSRSPNLFDTLQYVPGVTYTGLTNY